MKKINQKYLNYQKAVEKENLKEASILKREINSLSLEDITTIDNISEFNLYILLNKYITIAIMEKGKENFYTERLYFTLNILLDKIDQMIIKRKEQIHAYEEAKEETLLLKETLENNESSLNGIEKEKVLDQFISSDKYSDIKYELAHTIKSNEKMEILEIEDKQEWFKEWTNYVNNFEDYDLQYLKLSSRNHPTMTNYRLPLIKPISSKTKRYVGENSNELWLESYLLKNDRTENVINNNKIKKIRIS